MIPSDLLQQKQIEDIRRSVLWMLAYDADYTLGADMLYAAFDLQRKSVTYDQLNNALMWLSEQALIKLDNVGAFAIATLTDRGLEIARGKSRAVGVRDLRPSEIADIAQAGI